MTRTIRNLAAKLLVGAACFTPLALPTVAFAQQQNAPTNTVPEAKKLSAKEQHQRLLKSSGWIQQRNGEQILSHGTGWVLDAERRLMVTNDHVVAGQDTVWVVFPKFKDGKLLRQQSDYAGEKGVKATVIDRDHTRDLAVIQLDTLPDGIVALPMAAEEPEEGDAVRTIGGFTNGSDDLVFSGVGGEVRTVGVNGGLHGTGKVRVVLSTASINGGNSGGPLINEAGELVAVNSYTIERRNNRAVANTNGHISVVELKGYLAEVNPLVEPKGAKELTARGERKLNAGRFDAAIKDLSAAIAKDEKNAQALYLRGRAFTRKQDAATGLDDLTAAIKLDGGRYEYRIARGMALRQIGKSDEALAEYTGAIRLDPAHWEGYNERGLVHYSAGRFADAEQDFGRAIDKSKDNATLWGNRADTRKQLGKYDAAIEDAKTAHKLVPTNDYYVTLWGDTLQAAGKFEAAAGLFLEAAEKFNNDPVFLYKAADAVMLGGDVKKAYKLFDAAVKGFGPNGRASDVAVAFTGRGMCQRVLKNYQESVDDLTKAIELSGGKAGGVYRQRGLTFQAAGDDEAAAKDFATAEKLGVKVERSKVAKEDKPAAPVASPVLGIWKMVANGQGIKITQVIEIKKDGTFEAIQETVTNEGTSQVEDTGTWKLEGDQLTVRGKKTGTVVRTITPKGDNQMGVEMSELGGVMIFVRVK